MPRKGNGGQSLNREFLDEDQPGKISLCPPDAALHLATQRTESSKEKGTGPHTALKTPVLPPLTRHLNRLLSKSQATSVVGYFAFTHPNEQLGEINASNCQTIKSYIRGRIPQPRAQEPATDTAIIATFYVAEAQPQPSVSSEEHPCSGCCAPGSPLLPLARCTRPHHHQGWQVLRDDFRMAKSPAFCAFDYYCARSPFWLHS